MKKILLLSILAFSLVLSWGMACFGDFYVIPVKKKNFAPVPQTGQKTSYATGDDGNWQKGIAPPNPRFTDNYDGTATDNLTGLIWLKDANCLSFFLGDSTGRNDRSWINAVIAANLLSTGYCSLTDGSSAGDWQLPNVRELHSLIDFGVYPAQPAGHPFTGVQDSFYWSSTTPEGGTGSAWGVGMDSGFVLGSQKDNDEYMWPVRGGD
jgi:hypothetical protein